MLTKRIDAMAMVRFIVPPGIGGGILPEDGKIGNEGIQVNHNTPSPTMRNTLMMVTRVITGSRADKNVLDMMFRGFQPIVLVMRM
jgi:hypothetical protein